MKRQTRATIITVIIAIIASIIVPTSFSMAMRYEVEGTVVAVDNHSNLVAVEDTTGHTWEVYAEGLVEGQNVVLTLKDTQMDDVIENNSVVDIEVKEARLLN